MARVNEESHSFTCHPHVYPQVEWTIPAFTPQPQSITARWLVLISRPAESRRLSWPGWLQAWWNTEVVCPPNTVTHPSTNRARRRVTSSIRPTILPLRHAATSTSHTSRDCGSHPLAPYQSPCGGNYLLHARAHGTTAEVACLLRSVEPTLARSQAHTLSTDRLSANYTHIDFTVRNNVALFS